MVESYYIMGGKGHNVIHSSMQPDQLLYRSKWFFGRKIASVGTVLYSDLTYARKLDAYGYDTYYTNMWQVLRAMKRYPKCRGAKNMSVVIGATTLVTRLDDPIIPVREVCHPYGGSYKYVYGYWSYGASMLLSSGMDKIDVPLYYSHETILEPDIFASATYGY